MKNKLILPKTLIVAMMATPVFSWAAIPTTAPYVTDPQNSYVQDQTSEGISQLNMVMCIMGDMKAADMVNKGPYIALIDMSKCDTSGRSSASNSSSSGGSTGATAAPDYINAVVDVTRTDNTTPMLAKIWMSLDQEGTPAKVYVHVSATASPTDLPPYGTFRMDYIGTAAGSTIFNGFIDANGANISYLENDTDPMSSGTFTRALAMTSTSTTAGAGTMQSPDFSSMTPTTTTFNFGYDASETTFTKGVFRRFDGTNDVCFDRDITNVAKSTWRYGTYNANDGTRVDTANPGFPIQADDGTNKYFGYAGYWGINFQGLDLNQYGDGLVSNLTITDQRPGNTNTYTLTKSSGKLTKWTQNKSTLAAMDGIPFNAWADLSVATSNALTQGNWQMEWDDTAKQFVVLGSQTCGSNGCTVSALTSPVSLPAGTFQYQPLNGWSDSFGGNINIPPPVAPATAHAGGDEVDSYTQSDVLPTATVPTLECLNNCPTALAMSGFQGGSLSDPFDANTMTQWGMGPVTVSYSFGTSGLIESTTALGGIVTDKTKFTGQYQYGIQSGRLFATTDMVAGGTGNCPSSPSGNVCEPSNPTTYYTWQTGLDQWNQSAWLTNTATNAVVSFDPPQNISYQVPTGTAYGTWAGKTIQLQFSGFGDLQGIPGGCVSPVDNSPVDCGTSNARYVPDFAIPDGATMSLTSTTPATPLIVKALESEVRLAKIPGCTGVTMAQPTTAQTLPTAAGLHDPSSSTDAYYLGTEPTVTATPAVIDGVLQ